MSTTIAANTENGKITKSRSMRPTRTYRKRASLHHANATVTRQPQSYGNLSPVVVSRSDALSYRYVRPCKSSAEQLTNTLCEFIDVLHRESPPL